MKKNIAVLFLVLLSLIFAAAETPEEKRKRRLDTISFGIETEITDLIKILVAEKDTTLNDELKGLLGRTRNQKLSEAIFRFFGDTKWPGAANEAVRILENRADMAESLILSSFYYCVMSKSSEALPAARDIFAEEGKVLLPAVIKYFGVCGGKDEEKMLVSYFGKDITDALKQEIILALGGIGSLESVDLLIGILGNGDENKTNRMFAADSLGKLKDPKALDVILKATRDTDANLRQYALAAAAQFDSREARDALLEGFRDSNVKVRLESAKASGKLKLADAVPFLVYKAGNDPEKKMKEESFRALAEIGTDESKSFLDGFLGGKDNPLPYRELCWSLLLKYDRQRSLPMLRGILETQAGEKDSAFFMYIAREVSTAEGDDLGALAEILFGHSQFVARICGLEYVRKNRITALKPVVEGIMKNDPADSVRKKAKDVLETL